MKRGRDGRRGREEREKDKRNYYMCTSSNAVIVSFI